MKRYKDLREALRLGNSSSSSLSPSARGTITERTWKKQINKRSECYQGEVRPRHVLPGMTQSSEAWWPRACRALQASPALSCPLCTARWLTPSMDFPSEKNCSLWCCCCSSPRDLSPCRCHWDCRASGLLEKVAQLSGFVEAALASDKNFFHLFHRFSGFRLLIVYMVLKSDHLKWNWDDGVIADKERESAWKWT